MENGQDVSNLNHLVELDLTKLRPAKSRSFSRETTEAGVISIINSNCGKRISLSKKLLQNLNYPKTLKFSFTEEGIVIAADLPGNDISFLIKESRNKFLIYSAPLVTEITSAFGLDFTKKTSMTFYEVIYSTIDEIPVAIITIK